MTAGDLPALDAIAEIVHPAYPEDSAVLAERLALYPAGCLVLTHREGAVGYIVSHPWRYGEPPKLNSRLCGLPADPDTYYIHDIALLPQARGSGAASAVIQHLVSYAGRGNFSNVSLVAVNASAEFWRRHGFHVVQAPALVAKLGSYDEAARLMVRELQAP